MSDESNPRRPKRRCYGPKAETLALLKVFGKPDQRTGRNQAAQAVAIFLASPDQHPYGELQIAARKSSRKCPGAPEAFQAAYNYPELIPVAEARNDAPAGELTAALTAFALSHEADDVGIAPMDPL